MLKCVVFLIFHFYVGIIQLFLLIDLINWIQVIFKDNAKKRKESISMKELKEGSMLLTEETFWRCVYKGYHVDLFKHVWKYKVIYSLDSMTDAHLSKIFLLMCESFYSEEWLNGLFQTILLDIFYNYKSIFIHTILSFIFTFLI